MLDPMRAVRIEGPGRVELVEMDEPVPAPGEVLVRVARAALCATDRRLAALGTPVPRIPGHEVAGTFEDGTAVGVQPNVGCGRCASCTHGLENRCPDHVDIGIQRDGGLAEWIVVPERHAVQLDGFPSELAPSIEPLACCLHAVQMLDVADGDLTVVVGAGTLGIIGMWALQAAGARVAVVQRSEIRRRLAADLGADAVLEPGDDVAAALGTPPAAALVTAPGVEALSWAIDHVDVGGRVHAFAGTPGGGPVDANIVHYRHLRLVGSTGSTVQDYRRARDLARSGAVPLDRMPSRIVALEEVPRMLLERDPDPRMLRVVVRP
jgi:threonine dehydrogenase-like Zn-dependent dehydrogenase